MQYLGYDIAVLIPQAKRVEEIYEESYRFLIQFGKTINCTIAKKENHVIMLELKSKEKS